jgi:hypothetical protein
MEAASTRRFDVLGEFRSGFCSTFVFIHVGYVNHIVSVGDSVALENDPGYWRTTFSTFKEGGTKAPHAVAHSTLCPECNLQVPVFGECDCGWSPR